MKKFLLLMLVVWTGIASSCKYDDDELWGSVDDLANRISAMETLTQQMNGDIAAMQAIVTAVENQVAVSEVEKLTDGYILHFTNGQTATIKNGIDGEDGKDAPAVGLEKENGVYYWTLTVDGQTGWLTDEAGNKIAVANDPGAAGSTGSAGRTPSLKVDKDGYWMVSYDGTKFEYILDSKGDKVNAWGTNGVAQFQEPIISEDEETITIVMADGTEYVLPLLKALTFYDANNKEVDIKNIEWDGTQQEFEFTYELNLEGASYEIYDESGVKVKISMADNKATLDLGSNQSVSDARAVVLFFNETQTLTAVFKFKTAPWDGTTASEELVVLEGEGDEGPVLGIATPADLKLFANLVNVSAETYGSRAGSDDPTTYKLLNDIDLGNFDWEPIGLTRESAFTGVFDGNGKTITGLKVVNIPTDESGATTGAGLFGVIENATVKGLAVKDAKVELTGEVEAAGLIVGRAYGSVTLEDVVVENTMTAEGNTDVQGAQNVGSIAGVISGSNVTISGCEVKSANLATSTSSEEKVNAGGVVGMLEVKAGENGETPNVQINGCKVDGIELSASSESDGKNTSSSAGGVVGSLIIDDAVKNIVENNPQVSITDIIKVENNVVSSTQVTDTPSTDTGNENSNQTQGAVIGNLADLDASLSAGIMKDNDVSDDVEIETQLTVQNLEAVLNQALAESGVSTFTVKGTIEQAVKVEIPASGVDVTLNFDALATTSTSKLTIVQGNGSTAAESTHQLTINMPTMAGGQYLTIEAPETTVTLASGNYAVVTALTAKNTLVVEKDVVIERLEVEDGGVDVYGHVKNLVRKEGYTENVILTIKDGGKVDSIGNGFELIEGNPGAHELALKEAAKNGGSFTVTENLRLTSPLIVSSNFTLNFSNGAFWGDNGQFVDSKGWKAMVVVMPGATFTYNGGGEFNTGHVLTQLSCIRMVGGSDAPSKVIMNDGNLIGTYHAILIDEDCQNAEVEINGGGLSCDWWGEFKGVTIFNKSSAKITINNGSFRSPVSDGKSVTSVETWGGELNILGGTFETGFSDINVGIPMNPNVGNTLHGPAIAIAPKRDVAVNISGGTFTGNGSSSFFEKVVDDNILNNDMPDISLAITGGTFNASVMSQDCQGFISGGKFKVQPKDIYLVEGKSASLKGDYFEIVEKNTEDFVEESDGTYTIYTAKGWNEFSAMVNGGDTFAGKTVKLGDDIDFNNKLCTMVGSRQSPFSGNFDGKGYSIKNLKIESTENYVGLFSYVSDCTIKNVIVDSGEVIGASYVGALVGYAEFNSVIINCHNKGCNVEGSSYVGGIIGRFIGNDSSHAVIACSNMADVASPHTPGGITGGGYGSGVKVVACYNGGNVVITPDAEGYAFAGGIIADLGSSYNYMYACYNDGSVTDSETSGVLAGEAGSSAGNIHYSYSIANSVKLVGQSWSTINNTVDYATYNNVVDELNQGIELYNLNAVIPCTYKFVAGDKPTWEYSEPSSTTIENSNGNNFGNGGVF